MTTNGDGARRAEIAARIVEVREGAKMDQRAFVDALNEAARQLTLPDIYDIVKLSKIENGKRDVSLDDAILVAEVDQKRRGIKWIAGAKAGKIPNTGHSRRLDHSTKRATGEG